jgi:hypothetical protein
MADCCLGKYPTYLRAPYTDCTPESGCTADMKALGYHLVHYDVNTEDYLHPNAGQIQLSKDIVHEALSKAPEDGNMLTIQHDIISESSGNLTQYILQLAKGKGWEGTSVLPNSASTTSERAFSHFILLPSVVSKAPLTISHSGHGWYMHERADR